MVEAFIAEHAGQPGLPGQKPAPAETTIDTA
jgi:hypothetical protein